MPRQMVIMAVLFLGALIAVVVLSIINSLAG